MIDYDLRWTALDDDVRAELNGMIDDILETETWGSARDLERIAAAVQRPAEAATHRDAKDMAGMIAAGLRARIPVLFSTFH